MSCAGAAIANANGTGWSRLVWAESVIASSYKASRETPPSFDGYGDVAIRSRRISSRSLPLGLGPGRRYHGDIAARTSHTLDPRAGQREGGRGSLLHEPIENDGSADRNYDDGDAGGKKSAHSSLHSFRPHPADNRRMAGLSRGGLPNRRGRNRSGDHRA
jgi:hypothetical protein